MSKTITVTLSKGKVTIKTTGYAGASCLEATKRLEGDLGIEKTSDTKTEEFSQTTITEGARVRQ